MAEEEEEGAEQVSDEVMAEDEERAPSPLLNEFEKFPEYLEIEFKPQAETSSKLLTTYNKFALN